MITGLVLATSLMFSTYIKGADAYVGDDMTDEDFESFVDKNYEQFNDARKFIHEHRDALYRGMLGGAIGIGLKNVLNKHPAIGGTIIAGAVEFAKEIYKETSGGSREDRLDEMQRELDNLKSVANQLSGRMDEVRSEDIRLAEEYNAKSDKLMEKARAQLKIENAIHRYNMQHDPDYRTKYASESADCGPHSEHYRYYRDPETREIRDTIDRIYHDSVNPRSEYVTPDRYERSESQKD